jgi:hypothetical protein
LKSNESVNATIAKLIDSTKPDILMSLSESVAQIQDQMGNLLIGNMAVKEKY